MSCIGILFRSPVVCGVSSLGMDHMSILGDTLDKIAWNKGGIFKVCDMFGGIIFTFDTVYRVHSLMRH